MRPHNKYETGSGNAVCNRVKVSTPAANHANHACIFVSEGGLLTHGLANSDHAAKRTAEEMA